VPNAAQGFLALPLKSKIAIAVSVLGIVGVMLFMLKLASAPSYSTLASSLAPADTGKVTAALDAQGIGYELQANGTAVAVEKAKTAEARIALASAGVDADASSSQAGFELFDEQKLGASDFQQRVTYQRALEGEIAKTLGQVQGVTGAQVQLVLPEETLFADESSRATAAVMLSASSSGLDEGAVRGIASLTASSVKDLKPADVTITDSTGQVLWPQGDGAGGGAAGSTKQSAEARYESALQASLNSLLASTVGAGKGRVQVKADLDVDKTTKNQVTIDGAPVPVKGTTENETLTGDGAAAAGGATGTGANIPSYTQGNGNDAAGSGAGSNYKRTSKDVENLVPKTVTTTDVAPGGVNQLQVALLLDKSVEAQKPALEAAISRAAGLDTERGDLMTTQVITFAKAPEAPKAGPVPVSMLSPLKYVGIGLATLLFMFFMSRFLKRREGETIAQPSWLTDIDRPTPLSELEGGGFGGQLTAGAQTVVLPQRTPDPSSQALEQLVDREPDRVAAQMRQWMSEE
jgi:flagellar M-ring protein FliF